MRLVRPLVGVHYKCHNARQYMDFTPGLTPRTGKGLISQHLLIYAFSEGGTLDMADVVGVVVGFTPFENFMKFKCSPGKWKYIYLW